MPIAPSEVWRVGLGNWLATSTCKTSWPVFKIAFHLAENPRKVKPVSSED